MDLSVVITTYNRAEVLRTLLESLEGQSDLAFQVIVAIDGSTDSTHEMLARLCPSYDLKWVDTKCAGYGLAVARNMGIVAADGKAVVVVDDDSFPDSDFVAAHKKSVREGVISAGPRFPANPEHDHRLAWKMEELLKLPALVPFSIPELRRDWPNVYLLENNICLFREDWIRIGLFSERLKLYGFIGQEFFARTEFLGLKFQLNPAASIRHHGELAGDNGLHTARKIRERRRAELLRPSLMSPRQFQAQIAWARAFADGSTSSSWPGWRWHAFLALPWRYLHRNAGESRRWLRSRLTIQAQFPR
jgi:glycosyltransferase involved in cell wall biosynthesis